MKRGERVVLITASGNREAERLSRALVERKLAACVNIVPRVRSRYWWKGKIETAGEALLIVKTQKRLVPELIRAVRKLHSYTVPEVISLAVEGGNPDYLSWIADSVLPR